MESPETPPEISDRDQAVNNLVKQIRMFMALKYCKTDNVPAEVLPGLYIGSIGSAMNKNRLKAEGITHVLCVADNTSPIFPEEFCYKIVKVLDSPEVKITDYLPECIEFINAGLENGKVLVHW
jgi:hypothetical protein